MNCSTPGFLVHHQLLELAQIHVFRVGDAIQPSHPLSFHSPPAFNLSQRQGLFQGVNYSHQTAKMLEFQHQFSIEVKRKHWDEAQAGIKTAGRNINNLRYADDTTLMAESEEEMKSLLVKMKVESEKACLKLNIQKTKIMAFSPITSWQIDGETMATLRDFTLLGSKITVDSDCSHEIKRRLLLRRKVMMNSAR